MQKYYNTVFEAVINLPDPNLGIKRFEPGPLQRKWLDILKTNPPKAQGRLKGKTGHCCLGLWLEHCSLAVYEKGVFRLGSEQSCSYLLNTEVERLGLIDNRGSFSMFLNIAVRTNENDKVTMYAEWVKGAVLGSYYTLVDSLTTINDNVSETHLQTAAFIEKFPHLVFKEPK